MKEICSPAERQILRSGIRSKVLETRIGHICACNVLRLPKWLALHLEWRQWGAPCSPGSQESKSKSRKELDSGDFTAHKLTRPSSGSHAIPPLLLLRPNCAHVRLLPHPARRTLPEKSADPFLGIASHSVHAHHFFRIRVRLRLVEVDLRVVGLLADRDHERTRFR